jgi:PAS domain-containing protein
MAERDRIQTSVRLPRELFLEFRKRLLDRRQNMNAVLEGLVEAWLASDGAQLSASANGPPESGSAPSPTPSTRREWSSDDLLRAYVRWLPAVVLVKEVHGRVICANERFLELVGRRNVVGQLPTDYFDKQTGGAVLRHDSDVHRLQKALLCIEQVSVQGVRQKRIAIRFPILEAGKPVLTGALGFDDEFLSKAVTLKERDGARACRLPSDHPRSIEISETFNSTELLEAFVESLPAIAAVKDLDGRLLCVNGEYFNVTGKRKRDVINRLPTENWPAVTAQLVMAHDQLVRETQSPFMSVETLVFENPARTVDRLNLRFPIFGADGELVLTGTIGFDYHALLKGLALTEAAVPGEGDSLVLDRPATKSH